MVVTPKITDTDLTNMAKIQITESDIRQMVAESLVKLYESSGTLTAGGWWYPRDSMIDYGYATREELEDWAKRGIVSDEFLDGEYGVEKSQYVWSTSGDYFNPPEYGEGEAELSDEDGAQDAIAKITDEAIRQKFADCFERFCDDIDMGGGDYEEDWGPDPDDAYESWRDSQIEEGIDEYSQKQGSDGVYEFDSADDFGQWIDDFGLNLVAANIWVDLGPRHECICFYPKEATLKDGHVEFSPDVLTYNFANKDIQVKSNWMADKYLEDRKQRIHDYILGIIR